MDSSGRYFVRGNSILFEFFLNFSFSLLDKSQIHLFLFRPQISLQFRPKFKYIFRNRSSPFYYILFNSVFISFYCKLIVFILFYVFLCRHSIFIRKKFIKNWTRKLCCVFFSFDGCDSTNLGQILIRIRFRSDTSESEFESNHCITSVNYHELVGCGLKRSNQCRLVRSKMTDVM